MAKKIKLTTEWLAQWAPSKQTELGDAVCRGLMVRSGPAGVKVFFRWVDDFSSGTRKRRREDIGIWAAEGGHGRITLAAARDAFLASREAKVAERAGAATLTVAQLAEAYRRDVLAHRERGEEVWNVLRVHVLEAAPVQGRPPFGEWDARAVKPLDVSTLVRHAAVERKVLGRGGHERTIGGASTAHHLLAELKGMFRAAVGSGALPASPAALIEAKALGLRKVSRARKLEGAEVTRLFEVLDLNGMLAGTAKPQRLRETTRLALALLLYVPCRSHSLIGARWEEVDFDARTWTIPVARLKMQHEARATAKPLTMPLPATAVAILRRLKLLAGSEPWVLASPKGEEQLDEKTLVRALNRLHKSGKLGAVEPYTVHDLRRTWRSWADDLEIDFAVAERNLGHTFGGVAATYARGEMLDRRAQAADVVAKALDACRGALPAAQQRLRVVA